MKVKHAQSMIAAVALVVGAIAVVGAPAMADNIGTMPSGCGISASNPTIDVYKGVREIVYGGSAHCAGASSIEFRLVHNYTGLPDVRVADSNIPGDDLTFHGTTCDNGGTTQYYSELAFDGLSTTVQRVSSTVTLTHC
jgi:hypothetical protein